METTATRELAPVCTAASPGQNSADQPEPSSSRLTSASTIATSSSSTTNPLAAGQSASADPASFTSPDLSSAQSSVSKPDKLGAAEQAESNDTHPKPSDISCARPPPPREPKKTKSFTIRPGQARRRVQHPHRTPNPPLGHFIFPPAPQTEDDGVRGLQSDVFSQEVPGDTADLPLQGEPTDTLSALVDAPRLNRRLSFMREIQSWDQLWDPVHNRFKAQGSKQAQEQDSEQDPEETPEEKRKREEEAEFTEFIHNIFLVYPGPDMAGPIRALDLMIEALGVTHPGFGMQFIEARLGRYTEETKAYAQTMQENKEQLVNLRRLVFSKKQKLMRLQDAHTFLEEELIHRVVEDVTPDEQTRRYKSISSSLIRRRFQEITAQEPHAVKAFEDALRAYTDALAHGTNLALNALRWDYDLINSGITKRITDGQRLATEDKSWDMAIAAAMMGVRVPLKEQDEYTANAILDIAEPCVKKMLKPKGRDFSALEDMGDYSVCNLKSNLDSVITTIPEWFTILESKGTVKLYTATPMDRFKELVQFIGRLPSNARAEQRVIAEEGVKKPFIKRYHNPGRGWPTAKQRIRGGWWTCRSTPDAYAAELGCGVCHPNGITAPPSDGEMSSESESEPEHRDGSEGVKLRLIMAEIEKAQVEANKKEQLRCKERMRKERAGLDLWYRRREWNRQGAGFEAHELLYGRDVNEINYRHQVSSSLPTSMPSSGMGMGRVSSILSSLPSMPTMLPSSIQFSDFKGKSKAVNWRSPLFLADTDVDEVSGPSQPFPMISSDIKGKGKAVTWQLPSSPTETEGNDTAESSQPSASSKPVDIKGKGKATASALSTPGSKGKGKGKHVSWQL